MLTVNKEKEVVNLMIKLYCQKKHHNKQLCQECSQLQEYADNRIDKCPHKETKTFCSNCETHCYKKEMRDKIKEVMRFSGPRMIIYHPIIAIDHLRQSIRRKK